MRLLEANVSESSLQEILDTLMTQSLLMTGIHTIDLNIFISGKQ
jgi:hypothetical protein